jgi:rSAM/selenodomain-associated transferase 1
MTPALLVIAKQPVPGQVKTRLCPPCTARQAAAVAEAALNDTLEVVSQTPGAHRTLVISGVFDPPGGWRTAPQRGAGLGERLANAFADATDGAALLIGMDTPQVTRDLLLGLCRALDRADAVLAPAVDGGWWALGLRRPAAATVLRTVPMSTPQTFRLTELALRRHGLSVARGPMLRDVDVAADAHAVARIRPHTRFAATVAANVPL